MNTGKFILFCLFITSFLSLNICVSDDISTLAYYSDVESSGDTFSAGLWNYSADSIDSKAFNENNSYVDNESFNYSDFSDNNTSFNSSDYTASSEADLLEILNSSFLLPFGNETQSYWKLNVKGSPNITLDKMQVWWNDSLVYKCHLTGVTINESEFFNGSTSSGDIIDGTNYSFNSINSVNLESCFDNDVSYLIPFSINITMGDGSVKYYMAT